jgi:hypothetical protein
MAAIPITIVFIVGSSLQQNCCPPSLNLVLGGRKNFTWQEAIEAPHAASVDQGNMLRFHGSVRALNAAPQRALIGDSSYGSTSDPIGTAGLPLYGADFVKGVPQGSYPFFRPSVSLFDLAAVSSSRPTTSGVAGARRNGQGLEPPVGGPPEGLGP